MTEANEVKSPNNEGSASSNCYRASDGDSEAVTHAWVWNHDFASSLIEVRPMGINEFYDGVEIWSRNTGDDDEEASGVLVLHKFPLLRGDVRKVCWALGVEIKSQ